jgi:hypothetical protein
MINDILWNNLNADQVVQLKANANVGVFITAYNDLMIRAENGHWEDHVAVIPLALIPRLIECLNNTYTRALVLQAEAEEKI